MSGTAATFTSLYAQFPDNGPPGNIKPVNYRNLIATVDALTPTASPQQFGAIGNGSAHPASAVYATLGALTAVYGTTVGGVTIARTNELDWLGTQKAIDTLNAGVGGTVYLPVGSYVFTNSNSVSDGSGTLLFPETGPVTSTTSTKSVNMVGCGKENTLLTWPNDLGTGHFAMTCTNRLNTTNGSNGVWRDFAAIGPNNAVALGSKPANMHGLGWAEYRRIYEVKTAGFFGGTCLNGGGQTKIEYLEDNGSYYGIYFDAPNVSGDNGDLLLTKCASTNARMAGIGIADPVIMVGAMFLKCGFFTAPYGIFKETVGNTQPVAIEECTFFHTQFEQLGNALFSDGKAAGAHTAITGANVKFEECEYQYNATFQYATNPHLGIFAFFSNFGAFEFNRPNTIGTISDACASQTNGLFEIDNPGALLLLRGDMTTLFPGLAGVAPIGTGSFTNSNSRAENIGNYPWSGIIAPCFGTGTNVAIGNILAYTNSSVAVGGCSGTTTEQIAGVCMLTNNGVSGGPIVIAQTGIVQQVNAGSNVISNGALVRASSSGQAITSSGLFQTTSKNIGSWAFGSGSSPNLVGQVYLQGIV